MPDLTPQEALEAINQLRCNVIATQSAGWSNLMYPLVAILDKAGFEFEDPTDEQLIHHRLTYGGAGGYPGHELRQLREDEMRPVPTRVYRKDMYKGISATNEA